ncbi:diiron oxygenase [Nocardia sp. NBC_01499]|uniref:diiron oxygenase n=1 Tax=Nocardia sp. NBC_01499 TaxID=2903597 RepID=UPI003867C950
MPALREALAHAADLSQRLSQVSVRTYQNPYTAVEWPTSVEPEADWFTSPEHVSLYGTPLWDDLDEGGRMRLAFWEAANFYSLNIHGEKTLMNGLASRLYRKDLLNVTDYLHHFLDEENKHSIYFGGFCTRYARIYPSHQVQLSAERARDVEDFLFFAKTMVFEEIADELNRIQAGDDRLHPLARFINDNHHREETRHLVFGREVVAALWQACAPSWDTETVAAVRAELRDFFLASWREYYNPMVYADAGFAEPWEVAELAWQHPSQRQRRRALSRRCLNYLSNADIMGEDYLDA